MSSKPTIVVARTGSPYRVNQAGCSSNGEFDTQGLVDALCDCGEYRVVYYGHVIGESRPDLTVIAPDLKGINEFADANDLAERLDPAEEKLRELQPVACVNLFGACPSWSWPDNPNRAGTQAFCMRYSAPCLRMIQNLGIPRIAVVTDPKCYARDCEMATIWPKIRPVAVLSQEGGSFPKRIQDHKYDVMCAYSGCEYWGTYGLKLPERDEKDLLVATCANSHFGEARLKRGRDDVWAGILEEWLVNGYEATRITGKGWEDYRERYPDSFPGVLDFDDMLRTISRGVGGPMIPQKVGFNSTKPRLHALMGSVPLPYGTGGEMTYDMDARILPLDHPCRVTPGPLGLQNAVKAAEKMADEVVPMILGKTAPNFMLLHECLGALCEDDMPKLSFDDLEAVTQRKAWYNKFGGYVLREVL